MTTRSSNWWDPIGFANKDAYSNALAYAAFNDMTRLSHLAGHTENARIFDARAKKLKAGYYATSATGVLAGWKSAGGKLHDCYFTFVNGMAATYGLASLDQGSAIWDKMLGKVKEVGMAALIWAFRAT